MHKNVLIFFPRPLVKNYGGAYTYLYNLKKALEGSENSITFLSDLVPVGGEENVSKKTLYLTKKLKRLLPAKLVKSLQVLRYLKYIDSINNDKAINDVDLSVYDIIHVHETVDLYRFQHLFKQYRGKLLLTPHSPKPYHLELLEDVLGIKKNEIYGFVYKRLEQIDIAGFSMTEALILPCIDALTGQQLQWEKLTGLIEKKQVHCIWTGIEKKESKITRAAILSRYNMPDNVFLICFNGRHNKTKGYDLLIEAANILFRKYDDLYFIVTGKKESKPAVENAQWIETGWINTPEDVLAVSDMVVVPNRETFFDLNVLECFSLGKYVLLSDTGGNKCFKSLYPSEGISFHEPDCLSFIDALEVCYHNRHSLKSKGSSNTTLYENHFTLSKFGKRYIEIYNAL